MKGADSPRRWSMYLRILRPTRGCIDHRLQKGRGAAPPAVVGIVRKLRRRGSDTTLVGSTTSSCRI